MRCVFLSFIIEYPDVREFAKFDKNVKQMLAEKFVDMSIDAGEKLSTIHAAGLGEKITAVEGGVKYKLPKLEEVTPSKNQMEANIREIIKMKPVRNIDANKLSDTGKDIKAIYREFFVSWGENIHSEMFGDIATKKSSIGSEFTHGNTAAKIASIEAIPSVISEGKIIDWFEKHKGLFRIVVAAPIKIGNTAYYMGVMLQRDNQNQRLYIHDVILEKEASDSTREHLSTTGPRENENLFMTSILERIQHVKEKSIAKTGNKNKLPVASGKNFRNGQNAKGEFVANILIDLADSNSEWWTGRYNRAILGMSKTDDTEFRQFYQEIEKRTKDMDEYGETDQPTVEDSFTVQDEKGREFVYRVALDGYLHGVVLGKIDKSKYRAFVEKYEGSREYGRSSADTVRRVSRTRIELGRENFGSSRSVGSDGDTGPGRMAGKSSGLLNAGDDRGGQSAHQAVHDTTGSNDLKSKYKLPVGRDTSDRAMLVDMFEKMVTDSNEHRALQYYREHMDEMLAIEEHLQRVTAEIRRLSFAEGPRDMQTLNRLKIL